MRSRVGKTERLDQVLIRLGHATPDQIQEAVQRQATHGGRVGMNLVELGAITQEQLFDALVEQFRVPTTQVEEGNVPRELLEQMPEGVVAGHLMLPMGWDPATGVLSLAVANPSDEETIESVKAAFGAKIVKLSLAPENVLSELARRLLGGEDVPTREVRLVELPELFGAEEDEQEPEAVEPEPEAETADRVLMVTSGRTRKSFLPPVFEREGYTLVVATDAEEAGEALAEAPVSAVLLASDMQGEFARWRREGLVPDPEAEATVFTSVSGALLDNPVPYGAVVQSLRTSVQALSEQRAEEHGSRTPYGLIANDLEMLAASNELRRIVTDGLSLAAHLLLPVKPAPGEDPAKIREPFDAFASTLELASRLRFPWGLEVLLSACHGLYSGRVQLDGEGDPEVLRAAQLLAIAWFRHTSVPALESEDEEEALLTLRTALRGQASRLATLDVIEDYLQLISERGGAAAGAAERQVLLVGAERIARAMGPALERLACQAPSVEDLAKAQTIAEGSAVAAIVVDHEIFGEKVAGFGRVMKLGGGSLLFVLTDSDDPALVLNLLDIGVDDVFGPPHDFDLIAARINRAIRSRSTQRPAEPAEPGQFSATFEAFSFLDLAQMLSNGMKTVRVDFSRGDGEEAVLYLVNGTPVCAMCGDLKGPQAVYRVITWEEQGEFTVREDSTFPEQNIEESTESLLMEGVRLLDESRA